MVLANNSKQGNPDNTLQENFQKGGKFFSFYPIFKKGGEYSRFFKELIFEQRK